MNTVMKFARWWYAILGFVVFVAFVALEASCVYYMMRYLGCLPQ
jgi:hypothetical protein